MSNDIRLQEGLTPVDENLRPLTCGGLLTSIELTKKGSGCRINGDLEVTGGIKGNLTMDLSFDDLVCDDIACGDITADSVVIDNLTIDGTEMDSSGAFTLDVEGDITIDSAGQQIYLKSAGNRFVDFDYAAGDFIMYAIATEDDYFKIDVTTHGVTTIQTVKGGVATGAHLEIKADGNMTLTESTLTVDSAGVIDMDSGVGLFKTSRAGTEFSPANSSYAGMILGYTEMAYGTTTGRYIFTTSMAVITDNYDHGDGAEDHFLGVTFVVPPSNKVEIEVFLPYVSSADGLLKMGLATDTSATTLKDKFEAIVWDVDESDTVQVVQRWVIDGSDSGMTGGAWSAGESKTLYCMVQEGTAGGRLYWGDGFATYGDMTMKATALPATIGDGT